MGTWAKGGGQHDAGKTEYHPQPLVGAVTEEVSKCQNQGKHRGLRTQRMSKSESVRLEEPLPPSPLVDRKGFSALTFQGLKPRDVLVPE